VQYFQRLDTLSRQLEEEKKARENEKLLAKRMDQLTSRMTKNSIAWTIVLGLLFVSWPTFANQITKYFSKLVKSYWRIG